MSPLLMKDDIPEKIFLEGSNYYSNIFVTCYIGCRLNTVKSNAAHLIPRLSLLCLYERMKYNLLQIIGDDHRNKFVKFEKDSSFYF